MIDYAHRPKRLCPEPGRPRQNVQRAAHTLGVDAKLLAKMVEDGLVPGVLRVSKATGQPLWQIYDDAVADLAQRMAAQR